MREDESPISSLIIIFHPFVLIPGSVWKEIWEKE